MRRLALVVLSLALVASGCSKDSKPQASSSSTTTPEKPRAGGVLKLATTRLTTLDPAHARSVEELLVADQLFDGLTAWDTNTMVPVGRLALNWQVSSDLRQWDFTLDPKAKFSNGRAIGAADVKYSIERIAQKGSGSPGAELLAPVEGYDVVAKGAATDLKGITAPSPGVVHISLTEPWGDLPTALGSPQFGIVPKEAVDSAAPNPPFASEPGATSGPFMMKSRSADAVVLVRSPSSKAFVSGMEIREFPDVAEGYAAFRKGGVDWARVPPEEVDAASQAYGSDNFSPYVAELFYGFNLKNPKFSDVRFREAIVRAVDRKAIATAVYGGTVSPLAGVVVDGVPGAVKDPCGERCAHTVEQARKLIGDVFGGGGAPPIQINYDQDPTQEKVAKAVQSSLAEVKIPTQLIGKPPGEYGDFVVSGQQDLFRLGWIAAYPSPDAFITPLFRTGSRDNLMGFSSQALDGLISSARAEVNLVKRADLWGQAERLVMQELPVVPLVQFKLYSVASKRTRGLRVTVMGTFDASSVWLKSAKS